MNTSKTDMTFSLKFAYVVIVLEAEEMIDPEDCLPDLIHDDWFKATMYSSGGPYFMLKYLERIDALSLEGLGKHYPDFCIKAGHMDEHLARFWLPNTFTPELRANGSDYGRAKRHDHED